MLRYEIKKVFSRKGGKIAAAFLFLSWGLTVYFAVGSLGYVNEEGVTERGFAAAGKLKEAKRDWEGTLTEDKIRKVIEENARINATEEYRSPEVREQNIAYGWKQGFSDIRDLVVKAFCEFREYDYYKIDSLSPSDAGEFYGNRVKQLREWLNTDDGAQFSEDEKAFLIHRFEETKTPFIYEDADGWRQLFEFAPTLFMLMLLILGFLVAGIFSEEFQLKADAVYYSAYHGRGKAAISKLMAGFWIVTGTYWFFTLTNTAAVLGILGSGGADCVIQSGMEGYKSFYNITYFQEYLLLIIGGYVGSLFLLFLTMLTSALTRSSVPAVALPFIALFLPSFLGGIGSPAVQEALGLLPDQLLQLNMSLSYFNLYCVGGKIYGAVGILLTAYSLLFVLLLPVLYRVCRKAEIR